MRHRVSLLQLNFVGTMESEYINVRCIVPYENGDIKFVSQDDAKVGNAVIRRRRVTPKERAEILKSTDSKCYICGGNLPELNWHVEHVICFHADPKENDKLCNMLPACQSCNLRKNTRNLVDIVRDHLFTTNVLTAAANIESLSTAAKEVLRKVLAIKHSRRNDVEDYEYSALMAGKILEMSTWKYEEQTDATIRTFLQEFTGNHPELPRTNIDVKPRQLSAGGFGAVFGGTFTFFDHVNVKLKTNPVVIKKVRFNVSMLREVAFLGRFSHVNIVRYHGYYLEEGRICMVLERCDFTLAGFAGNQGTFYVVNPFKVICQVAEALMYMHMFSFIHRDVKPGNILILGKLKKDTHLFNARAKLCDFGSTKGIISNTGNTVNPAHTPGYFPDEGLDGLLGPSTDGYGLAHTMLDFAGKNGHLSYPYGFSEAVPALESVLEDWIALARSMQVERVEDRPSLTHVCERMKAFSDTAAGACDGRFKYNNFRVTRSSVPAAPSGASAADGDTEETETSGIRPPVSPTETNNNDELVAVTDNDNDPETHAEDGMNKTEHEPASLVCVDDLVMALASGEEEEGDTNEDLGGTDVVLREGVNDPEENSEENSECDPPTMVWLHPNARRQGHPKGNLRMKFHSSRECGHVVKHRPIHVELTDAVGAHGHTACKFCAKR